MRIFLAIASLVTILISASVTAFPIDPVRVGDKEWRQLTDTQRVSYTDLSSIYDPSSGEIINPRNAVLENDHGRTVDFAGWSWASLSDTLNFFGKIPGHSLLPNGAGERNSTLGDLFEQSFQESDIFSDSPYFTFIVWEGWLRDATLTRGIQLRIDRDFISEDSGSCPGGSSPCFSHNEDFIFLALRDFDDEAGVWLFRDATEIPEPGTLAILGIALAGLAFIRKKQTS